MSTARHPIAATEPMSSRVDGEHPCRVAFGLFANDPYAVNMAIQHAPGEPIVLWLFDRDLITAALATGAAGVGGVRIVADPGEVVFTFTSPEGTGWLSLPRDRVQAFADLMAERLPRFRAAQATAAALDVFLTHLVGAA